MDVYICVCEFQKLPLSKMIVNVYLQNQISKHSFHTGLNCKKFYVLVTNEEQLYYQIFLRKKNVITSF